MQELNQKPTDLRNVRLATYLKKKSSSFPGSWNKRYIVLSANFIYVYKTPTDLHPRRVICVDDSNIKVIEGLKQGDFGFSIETRVRQGFYFAAESAEERAKWLTALANAGYSSMYSRTREAVKFLDKCKEVMAPLALAIEKAIADGKPSEEAAATCSTDGVEEARIEERKAIMTGADVVTTLSRIRLGQLWSSSTITTLRKELADLEVELDAADADAEAAEEGKAQAEAALLQAQAVAGEERKAADAARAAAASTQSELTSLTRTIADLSDRNAGLQSRVEELGRELTAASLAAARVRAAGEQGSGASQEEAIQLRARVAALEAAIGRERDSAASQLKSLQHALDAEKAKHVGGTPHGKAQVHAAQSPTISPRTHTATAAVPPSSPAAPPEVLYEREWAPFLAEAQRLEREGNYGDAEQQYENVLSVKRDRCGANSTAAAAAHRDLGRVLALQRKFERAEDQYSSSVRLCTTLLGEAHPNTACALTDLAAVLREQGKFEGAERYAARAVDSLRAGVGPDDVSTATALYNLAGLAKRQGKFKEAEAHYGEALRIFRERLGEGQGETADTLYQMGCLYRKRNDFNKAGVFFQQAADSYAKTYGPSDKRVAEASKRAKSMQEKTG